MPSPPLYYPPPSLCSKLGSEDWNCVRFLNIDWSFINHGFRKTEICRLQSMDLGTQRFSVYRPWIQEHRDFSWVQGHRDQSFTDHRFRTTGIGIYKPWNQENRNFLFTYHGFRNTGNFHGFRDTGIGHVHAIDSATRGFFLYIFWIQITGIVINRPWIQDQRDFFV